MSIQVRKTPVMPMLPLLTHPHTVKAGFATAQYQGVQPQVTVNGSTVSIKMTNPALSNRDTQGYMKLTLLPVGKNPNRPNPAPKLITVKFKNGESAVAQAKQIQQQVLKETNLPLVVNRQGSTVKITQYPPGVVIEPRPPQAR